MALRVMEPQEPYNTKEDLLELAQEYKELKQNQEKDKWKLARLAQEAAQKFDLKQFAKETGENYDILKNLSYIAGRYTIEEVSNCTITLLFEHFIVAAKADNRLEWLRKAGDNAWSAARLRREMNPPKPVEKKESVPERKIEPEIVKPRVDPYGPVVSMDQREDAVTIDEIVAILNYQASSIREWAETYVIVINSLFALKTAKRIIYNGIDFEISVSKE